MNTLSVTQYSTPQSDEARLTEDQSWGPEGRLSELIEEVGWRERLDGWLNALETELRRGHPVRSL
jgi:hypothetical protein